MKPLMILEILKRFNYNWGFYLNEKNISKQHFGGVKKSLVIKITRLFLLKLYDYFNIEFK